MADFENERQQTVTVREPAPEWAEERETAQPSKGARARSYFREHPRARWVLLGLLVVAAAVAVLVYRYYAVRETTDDAQVDGHIGSIAARVGGTVINVYVDENQVVKKGQLLAQLDRSDYEVALQRAQGELADAEAQAHAAITGVPITSTTSTSQLNTANANLNAAQREVDVARARERAAQADYNKVAQDLKRMQLLVEKDEISRQQYDATVAAEQAARANLDAARSAIATAESHVAQAEAGVHAAQTGPEQIAVTKARANAAQANVQTRRAIVQQAMLNLQYTSIVAPFDGVVNKRSVEPGQVVQAGQPLFSLVDLEDLWVTANYKETQLKDMRVGQPAKIHVDAFGKDYNGHIDSFGGATGARSSLLPPENASGNFVKVVQRVPVKIVFDKGQDTEHLLRPGMSTVVTVITKH